MTSIDEQAFYDCSSLTSISIPNGVTEFGRSAFAFCLDLTSVSITESVTKIGSFAFSDCRGLSDVYCYATEVPALGTNTFGGIANSATLYVPAKALERYKTTSPWNEFSNIVPLTDEETGIENLIPALSQGEGRTSHYDLNGRRLTKMQKAINIVRYSDGSTRKVLVK